MPIGDIANYEAKQKYGVTMHNFPRVLAADIADKGATINDSSFTGKILGGQVMVVDNLQTITEAAIYVASGDADVSVWVVVQIVLGSGQVDVTPA